MQYILQTMNRWLAEGRTLALATVVKAWGSAPRREGAKMGISNGVPGKGAAAPAMIGSVSGGCVEGAVVEESLLSLQTGLPRLLEFGVADELAWEVGLTCGGRIEIFVEPLDRLWWATLTQLALADEYGVTLNFLDGEFIGEKALFNEHGTLLYSSPKLPQSWLSDLQSLSEQSSASGMTHLHGARIMVDRQLARPHLILVGGVHVAMPLQAMAREVGFRVSIVDPRAAFASKERFPDVANILHSYPDEALPQLGLDRSSYLAVLTHDPKIDDKALLTALPRDLPYVGVLSSSRTHRQRVERLRAAGLSEAQIARIRTPIGIDIGASSPEEIAASIVAEIIAVRNGRLVRAP